MRNPHKPQPTNGLTTIDRDEPDISRLADFWRTFDRFEQFYVRGFKARDSRLSQVTTKHRVGPYRGLIGRLAVELGMSESGLKNAKQRHRANLKKGDAPSEREIQALTAAVYAAVRAYDQVMQGEQITHPDIENDSHAA